MADVEVLGSTQKAAEVTTVRPRTTSNLVFSSLEGVRTSGWTGSAENRGCLLLTAIFLAAKENSKKGHNYR